MPLMRRHFKPEEISKHVVTKVGAGRTAPPPSRRRVGPRCAASLPRRAGSPALRQQHAALLRQQVDLPGGRLCEPAPPQPLLCADRAVHGQHRIRCLHAPHEPGAVPLLCQVSRGPSLRSPSLRKLVFALAAASVGMTGRRMALALALQAGGRAPAKSAYAGIIAWGPRACRIGCQPASAPQAVFSGTYAAGARARMAAYETLALSACLLPPPLTAPRAASCAGRRACPFSSAGSSATRSPSTRRRCGSLLSGSACRRAPALETRPLCLAAWTPKHSLCKHGNKQPGPQALKLNRTQQPPTHAFARERSVVHAALRSSSCCSSHHQPCLERTKSVACTQHVQLESQSCASTSTALGYYSCFSTSCHLSSGALRR